MDNFRKEMARSKTVRRDRAFDKLEAMYPSFMPDLIVVSDNQKIDKVLQKPKDE